MIDKKRVTAYNIKEVPKTRLKICGSSYKVASCIHINLVYYIYSCIYINDQNVRKSP